MSKIADECIKRQEIIQVLTDKLVDGILNQDFSKSVDWGDVGSLAYTENALMDILRHWRLI